MITTRRYTYKLRPGKQAEAALEMEYHRSRWVWNECVHQQRENKVFSRNTLSQLLTAARASTPWLKAGSAVVQQQVIADFCVATKAHFESKADPKPELPTFKTKKSHPNPSVNYTKNGFSIKDGKLSLAKMPFNIPVVWSRALPSQPTSVRVYRDAVGDWWASFVVKVEDTPKVREDDLSVGIDPGISVTMTTSHDDTEFDLEYVNQVRTHARNTAKYQRRMAKHKAAQQWDKYRKAKRLKAKEERKARRVRQERSRKWAQQIAKNHAQIAVEDFKPKFMFKSTLARKAADAACGVLLRELEIQAHKYNCELVKVNPAYTTQECHICHARTKQQMTLAQRTYECWNCGQTSDRDKNAAKVILSRAGFNPACEKENIPMKMGTP